MWTDDSKPNHVEISLSLVWNMSKNIGDSDKVALSFSPDKRFQKRLRVEMKVDGCAKRLAIYRYGRWKLEREDVQGFWSALNLDVC